MYAPAQTFRPNRQEETEERREKADLHFEKGRRWRRSPHVEKEMSAIEETQESAVQIVRQKDRDNDEVPYVCYALVVDSEEVADINKYDDGSWQVVIGEQIFGQGDTLKEAMNDAFTTGLNDMQQTIDYAKTIAAKHEVELLRQAEAMQ